MTPKECVEHGGHCYLQSATIKLMNPPIHMRECKHCGHTQTGTPQPAIDWRDDA